MATSPMSKNSKGLLLNDITTQRGLFHLTPAFTANELLTAISVLGIESEPVYLRLFCAELFFSSGVRTVHPATVYVVAAAQE
jgi:hypothetical protein